MFRKLCDKQLNGVAALFGNCDCEVYQYHEMVPQHSDILLNKNMLSFQGINESKLKAFSIGSMNMKKTKRELEEIKKKVCTGSNFYYLYMTVCFLSLTLIFGIS